MKLAIKYKPKCEERPWLIAVEGGEYSQHAHMHTMMRLLGEEKFKTLKKKDRYINSQKGRKNEKRRPRKKVR